MRNTLEQARRPAPLRQSRRQRRLTLPEEAADCRVALETDGDLVRLPGFARRTGPLTGPVRVQVINDETGVCFGSEFATATANTDKKFQATAP